MSKKTKIISIAIILTALSLTLAYQLISGIQNSINDNQITHYGDVEQEISKQVSLILQGDFLSVQDELNSIAQIPEIKSGNTEVCNKKLTEIYANLQYKISNIARIGIDKKFKCSINKTIIGSDATKFGPYINEIFNDPNHKPVLSRNVITSLIRGNVVAVHVPVLDDNGKFTGTIGAAIYFDQLKDKFLKDIKLTKNGFVYIVDDDGTILYNPVKSLIGLNYKSEAVQKQVNYSRDFNDALDLAKLGNASTARYMIDGYQQLATLIPVEMIPGRNWIVASTVPIQDIEDSVSNVKVKSYFSSLYYFLIICILLPPSLLVFYLIFGVFNPIKRVIISMHKVSEGKFDEKIQYINASKNDEIYLLITAFAKMESKLKESYTSLEDKVSQRTKQLLEAKNSLEVEVELRTKELQDAKQNLEKDVIDRTSQLNDELQEVEKINDLTIGRELKMVSLKNKIKELEGKIKKQESKK